MLKNITLSVVLAAGMCGKSEPAQESTVDPEVKEAVEKVPTANDGVPAANQKLKALKNDLQKTSDDRGANIDKKVGDSQ